MELFINGPKLSPRNPFNCIIIILEISIFDSFILAHELFSEVLQILETCLSVSNNLRRKLVSSCLIKILNLLQ